MVNIYSEPIDGIFDGTAPADDSIYHVIDLDQPDSTYGNIIFNINQKFPFTGELKIVIYCLHHQPINDLRSRYLFNYINELLNDDSIKVSVAYHGVINLRILPHLHLIKNHLDIHHNSTFQYDCTDFNGYLDHILSITNESERRLYVSNLIECYNKFWHSQSIKTTSSVDVILKALGYDNQFRIY